MVAECRIGRDGRRGRHGVGQPEMERELRALRQRAEQDQNQRRQIEVVAADDVARREHRVEIVAADDVADHQDAGQQAQPPVAVIVKRHPRAVARRLACGANIRSAGTKRCW